MVAPQNFEVSNKVLGVGLGLTAYTLGMRHAFDADHIACIDNTTRKLLADGKEPVSTGFWFSLGHSSVVFVMVCGIALGRPGAGQRDLQRQLEPVEHHRDLGHVGLRASSCC